jgi:hypothetical protein
MSSFTTKNANIRPFVYYQTKNREKEGFNVFSQEESGGDKIKLAIDYDEETGTVTLIGSGIKISYNDSSETVTLTGPRGMVGYNDAGTVTIHGTGT